MGTDSLSLHESKIRASLLLKELLSADPSRAESAARRFCALPSFAQLSPAELLARRESVQHKHALAVVAQEQGFASWAELKHALERPPPRASPELFFARRGSPFLNRWFTHYAEAQASREAAGGFLFPFRHQFFVCEADFLRAVGVDPTDPDWARIGFDWARPRDAAAQARLAAKLVSLGFSTDRTLHHPPGKPPMTSDSTPPPGGSQRRADMKRAYKEAPPPMGIYAVRNLAEGKVLLGASVNVPGALNRLKFELSGGFLRRGCPELQADWSRLGAAQFSFDTLDVLPASDEPRTGPEEELEVLLALWRERISAAGERLYVREPG